MRDFRFHTGESLPELRLHYTTVGSALSAVLLLHGTDGSSQPLNAWLGRRASSSGQPPYVTRYFTTLPDAAGRGEILQAIRPTSYKVSRATITTTWCAPNTDWSRSIWDGSGSA